MHKLILASASPRRQELLSQMGLAFEVVAPEVDEQVEGQADEVVLALAQRKALSVADLHPEAYVLAADTLVYQDGQPLGKPRDAADAARMLALLSGRWHEVHTGLCLIAPGGAQHTAHALTQVQFCALSEADIASYCDSGEPFGKAGAYAIQGLGGMYVEQICGSYSNVVGLPTALTRRMLQSAHYF